MQEIRIEQIGFMRPTIVRFKDKTIISSGLSISEMCRFWREEFEIYDNKVLLMFEKEKEFRPIWQRTLANSKSVQELFDEQGFICELTKQQAEKEVENE